MEAKSMKKSKLRTYSDILLEENTEESLREFQLMLNDSLAGITPTEIWTRVRIGYYNEVK